MRYYIGKFNGFPTVGFFIQLYSVYYLGKKNVSKTAVNGYHLLLKIFFLYNTSYYQILSHFYVICCPFQNQSRYSSVTVNCQPTYRVIFTYNLILTRCYHGKLSFFYLVDRRLVFFSDLTRYNTVVCTCYRGVNFL